MENTTACVHTGQFRGCASVLRASRKIKCRSHVSKSKVTNFTHNFSVCTTGRRLRLQLSKADNAHSNEIVLGSLNFNLDNNVAYLFEEASCYTTIQNDKTIMQCYCCEKYDDTNLLKCKKEVNYYNFNFTFRCRIDSNSNRNKSSVSGSVEEKRNGIWPVF